MSWQSELKNSIRNEDELAAVLGLSEEEPDSVRRGHCALSDENNTILYLACG